MHTTGIVKWFDRCAGVGVVSLADGGEDCVVRLAAVAGVHATDAPRGPAGGPGSDAPPRVTWRDYVPDIAAAERAGTWGDGGRDY